MTRINTDYANLLEWYIRGKYCYKHAVNFKWNPKNILYNTVSMFLRY